LNLAKILPRYAVGQLITSRTGRGCNANHLSV